MELRGIMHVHSTYSYDGKVSLSDIKKICLEHGIEFACMTEHTDKLTKETAAAFVRECTALSDDSFVFIPGFEVPYREAHVLHIGTQAFLSQTANTAQLTLWRKVTPLVVLAHPVRNHFIIDDPLRGVIDGIEIWNQQYDGKQTARPKSIALLNRERALRPQLLATGGLDFHRPEHFGAPTVTLTAERLETEAILTALKAGRFVCEDVPALGVITQTATDRWHSMGAIALIVLGKKINAALAACGLRLPKQLTAAIRQRL